MSVSSALIMITNLVLLTHYFIFCFTKELKTNMYECTDYLSLVTTDHDRLQQVTGQRPQTTLTTTNHQPQTTQNTTHNKPNAKHCLAATCHQPQLITIYKQCIASFATTYHQFIFPMNYKCQIANEHRLHRRSCYIFENMTINMIQHQHDKGENNTTVCCFKKKRILT